MSVMINALVVAKKWHGEMVFGLADHMEGKIRDFTAPMEVKFQL